MRHLSNEAFHSVWESEEWLKEHAKPLAGSGGEEETPRYKQLVDIIS